MEKNKREFVDPVTKTLLLVYFIFTMVAAACLLFAFWPDNSDSDWYIDVSENMRLFIIVVCSGYLGSSVHSVTSFVNFIGSQRFEKSWTFWYLVRGFIGAILALLCFLCIRGFVVTNDIPARYLNTYGLCSISILIGLFSDTIVFKLKEVFTIVLNRKSNVERQIDKIGQTLGTSFLDNYSGMVFVEILPLVVTGRSLDNDNSPLASGKYKLIVWFQPINDVRLGEGESDTLRHTAQQINITDGNDVEMVEFKITPKSNYIKFTPGYVAARISVSAASANQIFTFEVNNELPSLDSWVEIHQKNRLIVALPLI
ncbi:MAG TPA: hypothetical protein VI461_18525 [Chitinophagaceae bacterium]|nr:hypothetical protein [Chitinophagaceae bacterium]